MAKCQLEMGASCRFREGLLRAMEALGVRHPGGPIIQVLEVDETVCL